MKRSKQIIVYCGGLHSYKWIYIRMTDIVSRKCCKKYLIGLYVDISLRSEDFVAENGCDTARPDRVQF
jgi:hypothetical protein